MVSAVLISCAEGNCLKEKETEKRHKIKKIGELPKYNRENSPAFERHVFVSSHDR